jgi:hypothetical protein
MITEMKGVAGRFNDYPGVKPEKMNKQKETRVGPLFVYSYKKLLPPADGLVCCHDLIYQGIIIRTIYSKIKAVAFSSLGDDFNQFFCVF